jgi:hypothetical protein
VIFGNYIYAYKDEGEGGKWRRAGGGFSVLCGKGIIVFSRFFVEG